MKVLMCFMVHLALGKKITKNIEPWYRPTACHERSYALEPSCLLASSCFPELPCPSIYSGKFNHEAPEPSCIHRDPHTPPVKKLSLWNGGLIASQYIEHDVFYYDARRCNDTRTSKGDRGYFRGGRWTDRRLNRTKEIELGTNHREYCEYHWFCPEEIYNALEDYVLVFIGDSLIRQMFNRLIWHHRGLQEIVEHYYHQDAHYTASKTKDFFAIRRISNVSELINLDTGNGSVDALFFWSKAELMDKILWVDETIIRKGRFKTRPIAYVTGLGYHYPGEGYFHSMIGNFTDFHNKRISNSLNRLFWVPVPGNPIRNRYMRSWDEFDDTYILPFDKIARSQVLSYVIEYKDMEGIHFQCSFIHNGNGIMIYHQLRLRQYKSPRSGDCRDIANLNIIMIILNVLSENKGRSYPAKRQGD